MLCTGMSAGLPKFVTVNLADIELGGFEEGEEVSLESLKSRGILNPSGRDRRLRLKVSKCMYFSLLMPMWQMLNVVYNGRIHT